MWRRALGSFTAQAGASAALIALPEGIRDDVPLGVALGATYVSGAGAFYALGGAGPSIAARLGWYGLWCGPVGGSLAMGVSAMTASYLMQPGSPLSAEGAGKFAAALEASAPAGFAGERFLPPATARPAVLEAVVAAAIARPAFEEPGLTPEAVCFSLLELQKASEGDGATATDVVWALLAAAPVDPPPAAAPAAAAPCRRSSPRRRTADGGRATVFARATRGLGYYLDFPYQPLPKGFAPLPAHALPDATAAAGDAVSAAQLAWWVREARAATPRAFEGDDITARPGWFGERVYRSTAPADMARAALGDRTSSRAPRTRAARAAALHVANQLAVAAGAAAASTRRRSRPPPSARLQDKILAAVPVAVEEGEIKK
ncbi:hypothetical protein JL720_10124 [Aureococcus anophagefferens]|nr:hypothetical protein JL720_10124 [Aureococcus anophagefferens]